MTDEREQPTVTVAELLALLSLGSDLGMGFPMEHALRQSHLAVLLGERAGLDTAQRSVVYQSSLLAWVGCHIDAYEQAKWFGDDRTFKAGFRDIDAGRPVPAIGYLARSLAAGRPAVERVRAAALFVGDGRRDLFSMFENHWRGAEALIDLLGLGDDVRGAVAHTFERWDGKGAPFGVAGTEVALSSRLVNIADVADVFHASGGVRAAVDVVRSRRGTQFDPDLADLFCAEAEGLFAELAEAGPGSAVVPDPRLDRVLTPSEVDDALAAVGDFVDLKSPYTIGHSRGVARLAADAGTALGLAADQVTTLRRAASVHDLGRLGVSNAIWDKARPLSATEWERVRLHPYLTARMLSASPGLTHLATLAGQHHERLDGSGYPQGLGADGLSLPSRILAAADTYRTAIERRPHRPAASPAAATTRLRAEVRAGRLDGDSVAAVLGAAGNRPVRRHVWPAGLTNREVEVLRLVAGGLPTREIAERLVISPKTASNHIERIYLKIGATNRATAAVFAVRHGLTDVD